jgi:sec-independent protein translocase protein TatA
MRNIFDNPLLLIVLLLIIVLIFGAKRLPDAARSVGRSMRIFKSEVREMKDDERPASGTRPLEGRVVDDTDPRANPRATEPGLAGEPRRPDEPRLPDEPRRTDEPRRGS